jgi:hypothetical protein
LNDTHTSGSLASAAFGAKPIAFQTPRTPVVLSIVGIAVIAAASACMTALAILSVLQGWWLMVVVMSAVACFLAGLAAYVAKDLRGKWSLRVVLESDRLVLDLPAHRSLIHDPPAYRGSIAYADIAAIETRLEAYGTAGAEMMQQPFVLHRKNGELIFLFEDRALRTKFHNDFFPNIAKQIIARSGAPLRDLGMVEGKNGFFGVWGAHSPDWAAPSLPADRQRLLWRRVALTGVLPLYVIYGLAFYQLASWLLF